MATAAANPSSDQAVEQTGAGETIIENVVVAKIAAAASEQVSGIHSMGSQGVGGAVSGAIGVVTGAVQGESSGPSTQGVTVQMGNSQTAVSVNIVIDYGARIPQVVNALRQIISDQVQTMTGLQVKTVNVTVSDVYFQPQQSGQSGH
ncbi:MAG: Asp23/Gls24 family envelope stress response protein [Chloroflexota bacterium]